MLKVILYVTFSAGGLILLKIGTVNEFGLNISGGVFQLKINYYLIFGILLYALSFMTSLSAMKSMNLSLFYPISAGLIYVCVCFFSYFILKESISVIQFIGMIITLFGIIIMNVRS